MKPVRKGHGSPGCHPGKINANQNGFGNSSGTGGPSGFGSATGGMGGTGSVPPPALAKAAPAEAPSGGGNVTCGNCKQGAAPPTPTVPPADHLPSAAY